MHVSFLETVQKAKAYLEQEGRVSLRALRLEFSLDDEQVDALVEELVEIQRIAARDGRALAWAGSSGAVTSPSTEFERVPRDYTPKHLAERILRSKSALEGERKQVTVLFADVQSSMELAQQVDPERWHAILERLFQILANGVHHFEGTVNQYTGDGIMALFGAPIAHEDHAQRACYAALQLQGDLRRYAEELRVSEALDLTVRMGINSGEVVVGKIGDDLRMDYTAQGQTVHLAQRMEQLAEVGRPCLAPATAALVEGFVALEDLGEFAVKGFSAPLRVHALVGMGEAPTRLEAARARGLTRFVGRVYELASLDATLEQARSGHGQIVGVVGEAGVGKSRLCAQFLERVRAEGTPVYEAHCVSHGKTLSFLPMREMIRALLGLSEGESSPGQQRRKIADELKPLRGDGLQTETLALVFDFLDIADPEVLAPPLAPEARQRQLFDFVRRLVRSRSTDRPSVLFLDDAHWIDPGSDVFMAQIAEAVTDSRALLLVNFRPEYQADWMGRSEYQQLPLRRLGAEETDALLDELIGRDDSVAGLRELMHERTNGNPFFVEEVVRSLVDSAALEGERGACRLVQEIEALDVPTTVQPVLAGRIDRLSEREKQALQAAAVIGKEFSEPILSAVLDWPEQDLSSALQVLKDCEFILQPSLHPVPEYAFRHPLTQEVALGSQLRGRRVRTHAAVARALEDAHADHLDEQAALIAHHHEEADQGLDAAGWHARAAAWLLKTDMGRSIEHQRRVYELAESHPASPGAQELRLRACCMLLMTSPFAGVQQDERERLFQEGRTLAERLGDRAALFELEHALSTARILGRWAGEGPLAPARRAVEIARDLDLEAQAVAVIGYGNVLFNTGRLEEGLRATEEALALGSDAELGTGRHGASNANFASWQKALVLVWLGRPREAVACFERSRDSMRSKNELMMLFLSDIFLWTPLEELTGTSLDALSRAREANEHAEALGVPFFRMFGKLYLGWALLLRGQVSGALDAMIQADHLQRGLGIGAIQLNLGQGLLAEAHLAAGDVASARTVADRCTADLDTWVFDLRGLLSRARVLRALDGPEARVEIEATLRRADALLETSGARALAPFIVEERARLLEVLGDDEGASALLREAGGLFSEVGATGHVERLEGELSSSTATRRA